MLARPESVGMSHERLRRIDDHMQRKYIDTGKLAGCMTLVHRRGETAHLGILGLADRERGKRMEEDTVFRIYSMTKPLTSVLFMMLVEEGKVALDDPVHHFIPEWKGLRVFGGGLNETFQTRPTERAMQMVDLLRHTSGLTYGFQFQTNVDAAYRKHGIGTFGVKPMSLGDTIAQLGKLPLEFSPGSKWNYSVATDVLGYLIEVIEGRPFEQVMKDRLLSPLGMTDTDFQTSSANEARLAACYAYNEKGEVALQDDPQRSSYMRPPLFVSGGGGLVATMADYLRFCRMMLNNGELDGMRYLSPKTVALMTANHLPGGVDLPALSVSLFSEVAYHGVGFGLGFSVTTDTNKTLLQGSNGEYSWGGAASTSFWIDPLEDLIVIFMTQFLPSSTFPLRRELRTMAYSAITESNA